MGNDNTSQATTKYGLSGLYEKYPIIMVYSYMPWKLDNFVSHVQYIFWKL